MECSCDDDFCILNYQVKLKCRDGALRFRRRLGKQRP